MWHAVCLFPSEKDLFSHTFGDDSLSDMQGAADRKASILEPGSRGVNADENVLPSARARVQLASH